MRAVGSLRRARDWLRRGRRVVADRRRGPEPLFRTTGTRGRRRVVVIVEEGGQEAADRWRRDLAGDDVSVLPVGPDAGIDSIVGDLARRGTPSVLVISLTEPAVSRLATDHAGLFCRLFLHLRAGGVYVVDRSRNGAREKSGSGDDRWHRMLSAGDPGQTSATKGRSEQAVLRFVKRVQVSEGLTEVTKRGHHALLLRESEVAEVLPVREPPCTVSVLEVRPSGSLETGVGDTSHGPSTAEPWPSRLSCPEAVLRHYQGELLSVGGMRLRAGGTVLPESFRWPHARVLRNPRYEPVTPTFARVAPLRSALDSAGRLDGDFYFADCLYSGHFGHLTTEVLSRMWGWDRAVRELPELKVLFHVTGRGRGDGSLERRLFTALGIPESRLVAATGPVRLRSVVGASPMWHNKPPFHAHPDIREVWQRLTSGLLAGADPADHDRIFVSRGRTLSQRRGCRNQDQVERFFADRGFHVLYPEHLPLPDQARLFAGARVVAGFAGSALFNLMHCRRLEAVVAISHHAYVARNEQLFASVLGVPLHYFWQRADVEAPEVGRSRASDESSYAFDFDEQGAALARLLDEL